MKAADRSGASHTVVIGDRDLAEGVGQLKDMRTGEQHAVPVGELFETRACDGGGVMEQRPLGRTGADVSVIGLGTWQLGGDWGDVDDDAAADVLDAALDAGVTLLDTADVYGDGRSEERIRKALAPRSDRPFVATKAGRRADPFEAAQYTPENLRAWIDRSRRNLGVDTLDLVQLHCPPPAVYSDQRVYDTLDALVAEETIAAYGVSVETVAEGMTALQHPGVQSIQVILNIFRRKPLEELLPAAAQAGVGILARVPLASGLLTGKYDESTTFPADDHRNFNRHGEAFDVGETFAGVPVRGRRRGCPGGRRDRRTRHPHGGLRAALGDRPARRHHRHPRRPQRRPRSAATSPPRRSHPSPTPSSPTSSACTTSASAPTSTTAGEPALPLKGTTCASHPRRRHAARVRRRFHRHPRRLGGPPPRPRRRGLPRPPRRLGLRAGRRPRGGGAPPAQRVLRARDRRGAPPSGGQREPGAAHRRDRGGHHLAARCCRPPRRCRSRSRPTRRPSDDVRYKYRYLDLRRQGPAKALRVRSEISRIAREVMHRARVRRGGDAEPDPLDAGGCARLRRPGPAAAGQVVRAAAVAAAVQAAADDRRARAVLPDRPLLPGRGLPRRPAAGVHPARLRDELRRPRRRARRSPRTSSVRCGASWPRTTSRRSRG